jgi:NHLM bacteriocin system ABC transporter ATP-binding protein
MRDFVLNDSQRPCVVLEGFLDIFLVDLADGNPVGPLYPVTRAKANDVLFGLGSDHVALLARHVPGAQVQSVDIAETSLPQWLRWVECFTAASITGASPKRSVAAAAGHNVKAEDKPVTVKTQTGFLFVRTVGAPGAFMGDSNCEVDGSVWFPLSPSGWIQLPPGSTLQVLDPQQKTEQINLRESIRHFESIILSRMLSNRETERRQTAERLRLSRNGASVLFSRALQDLGSQKDSDILASRTKATADPVYLACRAAGRLEGFSVVAGPELARDRAIEERVHWVARASGFRSRRVMLRGAWWQETFGSMIGVLAESKTPVALLPSGKGYEMLNPVTEERIRVDSKNANLLEVGAFVLYRPFPRKPLTSKILLQFAFFGSYSSAITVVLMGLLGGLLGLVTPIVTGNVFDNIIPGAQRTQLLAVVVFSMSAAVSSALLNLVGSIGTLRMESRMTLAVQAAFWDRLLNLPATFFRKYSSADLAQRSMSINRIRETLSSSVLSSVLKGVFSLCSFGLLFYYDLRLALVASALTLFVVAVTGVSSYFSTKIQRTASAFSSTLATVVLQLLNGIAKIRVSGAENRAFARWSSLYARSQRIGLKARKISAFTSVFHSIVHVLSSIVIFYAMWKLNQSDKSPVTTGHFLAFNSAFGQFFGATLSLANSVQAIVTTIPLYERAKAILEAQPEVSSGLKSDPGELTGVIEINQLMFAYNAEAKVLNGISLSIKPGQFVAIVGPSGCGKSTLFRLLLGFEKPLSGGVYYDGQDLATLDIQAVRKQIGTVLQSSKLMNGSLYRNIVGDLPLTIDDAWEAARLAGMDPDITKMPMGMHTTVGDHGVGLSGGQRQRLMVARAIVSKPRIVLFDEATSALDNKTQAIVSSSLKGLSATRVVIAHRLSTIIHADRIYFLQGGRVAEAGTYDELIKKGGLFAEMAKRQLA